MKLLAIVITYYPNIKELKQNISKYIQNVDKLIIWDNTPNNDLSIYKNSLIEYENKIIYMTNGRNEGISYAINNVIKYGLKYKFTHLMTMDQDSTWDNFPKYLDSICKFGNQYSIYGPNINYSQYPQKEIIIEKSCITSGTVYNLNLFKKIGLFNEGFFIDAVDEEFGFRAYINGYSTAILGLNNLKQQYGETRKCLNLKFSEYGTTRTYFIVRNHIWLWRLYPQLRSWNLFRDIFIFQTIKRYVKIILVEKDKLNKLKAHSRGIIDGLSKRIPSYAVITDKNT